MWWNHLRHIEVIQAISNLSLSLSIFPLVLPKKLGKLFGCALAQG